MASEIRSDATLSTMSPTVAIERDSAAHGQADFSIEEVDVAGESCVTVYGRMQP